MKLLSFKGKKINEYINVNIDFNSDLTILIGVNGSGKTTSLDLIQALLLPNLGDLLRIPYKLIDLNLEIEGRKLSIISIKGKEEFFLNVVDCSDGKNTPLFNPFRIKRVNDESLHFVNYEEKYSFDTMIKSQFEESPVVRYINQLEKPVLIGLERTSQDSTEEYKDYLYERKILRRKKDVEIRRNYHKNNLGVSIMETEFLVQNIYKSLKVVQENFFLKIQKELISSSFDFVELDIENIPNEIKMREKYNIIERRKEIEDSLKSINFLTKEISEKLDVFFKRINAFFDPQTKGFDREITLEWLLNKAQIDKIIKVINILDEYKKAYEETFEPIDRFTKIINKFLKDTNKKIKVDEIGRLFISKPQGKDLTIDELSSGERQLIILFANIIFNKLKKPRRQRRSEIVIIDEPEISLHVRWQELFIDSLFKASDLTQFVIATHSPDIIGEYKFSTKKLSLK